MAEALAGGLKKQSEADSPVEFNFHGGVFYPKGKKSFAFGSCNAKTKPGADQRQASRALSESVKRISDSL